MADPEGVDQRRPEMVMLLRSLLYYGLSRYEPSPQRAYEAAEQRRRDLGMQTLGPPSAAYGLGEIGPPAKSAVKLLKIRAQSDQEQEGDDEARQGQHRLHERSRRIVRRHLV